MANPLRFLMPDLFDAEYKERKVAPPTQQIRRPKEKATEEDMEKQRAMAEQLRHQR